MPVWRPREDWLREAVRSALEQRDCDLELIIVDDGNDVCVSKMLDDLCDVRVRHVRIAHAGVSAARNAGIARAGGAFVRFIDADDVLELGSTARLRALSSASVIAYEDTEVCDEGLRPQYRISSQLAGNIAIPCLLGQFDCRHVSMLFPARVVEQVGPWDSRLRVRQDFDYVLRCLERAVAVPGDGTATFYRRHEGSATRSAFAVRDSQRSTRIVVAGFFARHPELRHTATGRDAWRRVYENEARTALHQRRPVAAIRSATPLLHLAPGLALRFYVRAARSVPRLSGATIVRTTAHVREYLTRRDR